MKKYKKMSIYTNGEVIESIKVLKEFNVSVSAVFGKAVIEMAEKLKKLQGEVK